MTESVQTFMYLSTVVSIVRRKWIIVSWRLSFWNLLWTKAVIVRTPVNNTILWWCRELRLSGLDAGFELTKLTARGNTSLKLNMQPPKKNRSLTNLLEAAEEACRSKMINMKRTSSGSSSKQKQRTGPTTELCLEHFGQFLTHTLSLEVEAQCVHRLEACLAHDQFQNTLNCMELALHSILESYPGLGS